MSNHTPGPWAVHEDDWTGIQVRSANADDLAEEPVYYVLASSIGGHRYGPEFKDDSEVRANAKLISAAPDLLEALQEMVSNEETVEFESWLHDFTPSGDCDSVTSQWLESSRYDDFCLAVEKQFKAIAKARGES